METFSFGTLVPLIFAIGRGQQLNKGGFFNLFQFFPLDLDRII